VTVNFASILQPRRGYKKSGEHIEKRASVDCLSSRENMTEIKTDEIMPEKSGKRENSFSSPFNQRPTTEFSIFVTALLSCQREMGRARGGGRIVCTEKHKSMKILGTRSGTKSSFKKCISVRSNLCGSG
jgi:hypothetical protein